MGYTVGKWEGDTLVLDSIGFYRRDLARARRLLPLRPDACRREVHPDREPDALRSDRRGSGSARRAVGHAVADAALWLRNNTIIAERGSCTESELKEVATQMTALGWDRSSGLNGLKHSQSLWLRESPSVWSVPDRADAAHHGPVGAGRRVLGAGLAAARRQPQHPALRISLGLSGRRDRPDPSISSPASCSSSRTPAPGATAVPFLIKMMLVVASVADAACRFAGTC